MGKERQSNFELLKIISMLGVIVLHYNHPTIGGAFQYVSFILQKVWCCTFWNALLFLPSTCLC